MINDESCTMQLSSFPVSISIEITTKCNFDCNYCYSKMYQDEMMAFDAFCGIVDPWLSSEWPIEFNLSGEGECLLHPDVWRFVEYIKTNSAHRVTFITNGSALNEYHRSQVVKWLDRIMISVDTTDVTAAEMVGRHSIDRVISNIRLLASQFSNITIMTVDYGQSLLPVKALVRELGTMHFVQKLQQKTDYTSVYPITLHRTAPTYSADSTLSCSELANRRIVYNIKGVKMPCCYIKDTTQYPGYDSIIRTLAHPNNHILPGSCTGCAQLIVGP